MKVLVYPHDLGIGGSQLNAVELAAGVARLGHGVAVVGQPGALVSRIDALGLEFVPLPPPRRRPSRRVADALVELVDRRGIDVLHGYEWPPTLEAVWACRRRPRTVAVSTVMSMAVPPFIPTSVPLVVGTDEIRSTEVDLGRRRTSLIEPPVDLVHNDPDGDRATTAAAVALRERYGIGGDEVLVVTVTRLAAQLKLEGLLTAVATVGRLAATRHVRLLVVGDGPERSAVEEAAAAANQAAGRPVVTIVGELADPRPAYAAADVTLGMGGSALRSLAYGAPLVVQGEDGFFGRLEPATVDTFLWGGWYGRGPGAAAGPAALTEALLPLLDDPGRRSELGRYGRRLVQQRFSLERAAQLQLAVYQRALADRESPLRWTASDLVAGGRYTAYYAAKRWRRLRGREASDDFNARPVAGRRPRPAGPPPGPSVAPSRDEVGAGPVGGRR